jgi:hypothetical protein
MCKHLADSLGRSSFVCTGNDFNNNYAAAKNTHTFARPLYRPELC